MLKLLGLLTLLTVVFGLGYYAGQRPIGELKKTVKDLSRNVLDTTLGLERNLRRRQSLVEAKARIIESKSELLNRNFGSAAKELAEALGYVENARDAEPNAERTSKVKALAGKIREVEQELSSGKASARRKLDEIQKELDALL